MLRVCLGFDSDEVGRKKVRETIGEALILLGRCADKVCVLYQSVLAVFGRAVLG